VTYEQLEAQKYEIIWKAPKLKTLFGDVVEAFASP
jgi:hypothetical protein